MTVHLGGFDFPNAPRVEMEDEAELRGMPLFGSGEAQNYTGHMKSQIILKGKLTGVDCYTDRDTLRALPAGGTKVNFYATEISFGSLVSPKLVWVRTTKFIHPVGVINQVDFIITIEEDT